MTLDIEYNLKPIDIFSLNVSHYPLMSDFVVKIDGKIAPDSMRDIILMGLQYQAGLTDRSFTQVMRQYLEELRI